MTKTANNDQAGSADGSQSTDTAGKTRKMTAKELELNRTKTVRETVRTGVNRILKELGVLLSDDKSDNQDVEIQLGLLSSKEATLQSLDDKILELVDISEIDAESTEAQLLQEKITAATIKVNMRLRKAKEENVSNGSNTIIVGTGKTQSRLPVLNIGKYSGSYTEFGGFWSRFESAVDKDPELSNVEKFHYLESYLEGEAKNVLNGMKASDANYVEAIRLLKNRFDKKHFVIHEHMTRLSSIKPVDDARNVKALRRLFDTIEANIRSLKALGVDTSKGGYSVCPVILRCMPDELRINYNLAHQPGSEWDVDTLIDYFRIQLEARESSYFLSAPIDAEKSLGPRDTNREKGREFIRSKSDSYKQDKPKESPMASASMLATGVQERGVYCIFCRTDKHASIACKNHSLEDKRTIITTQNRCFICIRVGHGARNCSSKFKNCKLCKGKHNLAICPKNEVNILKGNTSESSIDKENGANSVHCSVITPIAQGTTVLLQTAKANAKNPDGLGEGYEVRCLFDGGSQASFIKEDVARKLNLPVIGEQAITIHNFGNRNPTNMKRRKVRVTLQNLKDPSKSIDIVAIEVPYLCQAVTTINCEEVEKILKQRGLEMADPADRATPSDSNIGILIGGDHYWELVTGRVERFSPLLVALETTLGWAIQGPITGSEKSINSQVITVAKVSVERQIADTLKGFWELESLGINSSELEGKEGGSVREQFLTDIKFSKGRYMVTFPWKVEKEVLPDNFSVAEKRMKGLVRRFLSDPELYAEYKKIIMEQLEQGIIEMAPVEGPPKTGTYYMPHQPVRRESSSTTKLRIVFDASSHIRGAPSLNECLASGPNLTPDLLLLLLKFRTNKVAIIADIEKAFLQIALAETERDSVRFLWVREINGKLDENNFDVMRVARVPFGVTASPFLLGATVKHHIDKYRESNKATVEILDNQLYVDDLLAGEESDERAYALSKEAAQIMEGANMKLRKWQTNSDKLRAMWGAEATDPEARTVFEKDGGPGSQKVLGLLWDPRTDTFSFNLDELTGILLKIKSTKRSVLSSVARIFDPLGILAPFTIKAKFIFQRLWEIKSGWDDQLPNDLSIEFLKWCEDIPKVRKISLDRHLFDGVVDLNNVQLHCFCDSSAKAYASVVYIRYQTKNGEIRTSFVTAKGKVTPLNLKTLTLPRLELMSCVLGARLVKFVKGMFTKYKLETYMWTDSTIARHWIKGSATEWKPFVSNRVEEIKRMTDPKDWAHCPGKSNPADLPTRGVSLEELVNNELWLRGPAWLKGEKSEWPADRYLMNETHIETDLADEKRKTVLVTKCTENNPPECLIDISRFSSLNKALRVLVYILRFIDMKTKVNHVVGPITAEEMTRAEAILVKTAQREAFPTEIQTLRANKRLGKNAKFVTLKPFLNSQELLVVGGRLDQAELNDEQKHPIILDKSQPISRLIIKRSHDEVMHSGVQHTLTQVRERYWIISGRQLTRMVVKDCTICKRFNAKPGDAHTAPLPKERVTETEPFQTVGIDFAGPMYVKNENKNSKVYICLFTCAVTRSIHLELVGSLSTQEFLLAFRRMISRRGIPHIIYTDNGKTFIRANKDLKLIWESIRSEEVQNFFGVKGITWKFITERAAWHGGYWERQVRSTKITLRKILGRASLTYSELETILLETEGVINSRPITFVFNEVGEPTPLSPAHLLIGKRITCLPPQIVLNQDKPNSRESLVKWKKYRENLMERMWKRWRSEYLLELRSAHHSALAKNERQFKVGDVILIHDDKLPKQMWKLGIITELINGRDGKVRSCVLRTANGHHIRRPIQLLYALEISNEPNVAKV